MGVLLLVVSVLLALAMLLLDGPDAVVLASGCEDVATTAEGRSWWHGGVDLVRGGGSFMVPSSMMNKANRGSSSSTGEEQDSQARERTRLDEETHDLARDQLA